MTLYARPIRLLLWVATSVWLVVFFFDCLWSTSIDLADHNALVNRLFDYWGMPVTDELYPQYIHYPTYSHRAAAVLAVLLSSPLAGLQLLTLLSLVALWSGLALILQTLPCKMRALVAAVSALALLLNRFFLRLELHGNEIIGMFFFPQFVGQAFAIVVLAIATLFERGGTEPALRYLLLTISIPIAEAMHLVPAVQLFGVLVLLIATDLLAPSGQPLRSRLAVGALFTAGGAVGIVLHPNFKTMFHLGTDPGNEPLWTLSRTPNVAGLAALSIVVGLLSVLLLYKWICALSDTGSRRNGIAAKFVALYGLSNSGLCLLQISVKLFGASSLYACSKYGFALNTSLLIEFALLVGIFFKPPWLREFGNPPFPAAVFDVAFISLFLLAAVFAVAPNEKAISASELATSERFARTYMQTAFDNPPGKYNYAIGIRHMPLIDYLITAGALHAPGSDGSLGNTADISSGRPFSQPSLVAHILTSRDSRWDVPRCRSLFSSPTLVVVDGPCAIAALSLSECAGRVDFSKDGGPPLYSTTGFDEPDEGGSWTNGSAATFACSFSAHDGNRQRVVEITAYGYTPLGRPQRVLISINDGTPQQFEVTSDFETISIDLPPNIDRLQLKFDLPDAVSAKSAGVGKDTEKLGIFVSSITFGP